ncbi:MAG: hypothetical protein OXC62_05460, partial [Aestuariivita sp.]|nr:hypothetical protein [Aestuariivita sp.]
AVNEEGVPLGVPRIDYDCRDGQADKDKRPEDRTSARWLRGWRASSALAVKKTREMLKPDIRSQYPWLLILEEAHN